MPRSRGSETPQQRTSPRVPLHLKPTSSSEANSIRSPKLEDRRSPRSPLHERKKGPRVADLETKLGQAQDELEKLKEQLASAEAARLDALNQLEETKKHFFNSALKTAPLDPINEEKEKTITMEEAKFDPGEIPMQKGELLSAEEGNANFPISNEGERSRFEEEDAGEKTGAKALVHEEKNKEELGALETPQITELRANLAEKEKQLESVAAERQTLIKEANKDKLDSSKWREKAEEIATKLTAAEEELNNTKITAERLREKLESADTAKTSMETEMKRLRVQTEQWRKAAEAAASVLMAGDGLVNDGELNGRRLGESGRSMEKHLRGYDVSTDSGEGKRRGSGGGIRVFGELWKKKGQLK